MKSGKVLSMPWFGVEKDPWHGVESDPWHGVEKDPWHAAELLQAASSGDRR